MYLIGAPVGTKPYIFNATAFNSTDEDAIAPDFILPAQALGKKVAQAAAAAKRTECT